MASRVTYELADATATITMDDGKVNVLSGSMLAEIDAALDRAQGDRAVVVLAGRPGVFSAGFDLAVLRGGGAEAVAMLRAGFELAQRVLAFPTPVVVACSGHAVAMGAFLLLAGDYRIGVAGAAHKITANEVAIGLTMPRAAIEICRPKLTPAHFQRALNLAEPYDPDSAVDAGFLDAVVPEPRLLPTAHDTAALLAGLDLAAHATTKLRTREHTLSALRAAIDGDQAELLATV
jgi:enoyl-CoA hydratase